MDDNEVYGFDSVELESKDLETAGFILDPIGSLLIYATWTALFFARSFAPILIRRAGCEEKTLAVEYGEQWQEYCKRAPAFLSRNRKERNP